MRHQLSEEESSNLNRIIEELVGPWEEVKWKRSRRGVLSVAIELPLNLRNVFNLALLSSGVHNQLEYQAFT